MLLIDSRFILLTHGLRLEIMGIKPTWKMGGTCYSLLKREYGLKGNRAKVLAQAVELRKQWHWHNGSHKVSVKSDIQGRKRFRDSGTGNPE